MFDKLKAVTVLQRNNRFEESYDVMLCNENLFKVLVYVFKIL